MASSAQDAFGTTLTKSGGSAIPEIRTMSGPDGSTNLIDVTSHDSADQFVEYLAGIRVGGTIAISGLFVPGNSDQIGLYTDWVDGSSDSYVIAFPDAVTTWTASCIVSAYKTDQPYNDAATFSATLTVNGKPTLATS